jgi:hypothetical protein
MRYGRTLCWIAAFAAFTAAAAPAVAHHSFAAEYDSTKRVTFNGKVTKVEWMNPHAFFYIDVKDDKTNVTNNWACELGSPNGLMRLGWNRNSLKPDDLVTVQGSLAKDGSKLLNASSIVMTATGKRMFAGSSEESGSAAPPATGQRGPAQRGGPAPGGAAPGGPARGGPAQGGPARGPAPRGQ